MLRLDFWVTPEGTFEMGQSEHAKFALKRMFNLPESTVIAPDEMWGPSPARLVKLAKKHGGNPAAIEYMEQEGADPRWFAMKHYGWVRISKAKANLWHLTDATRAMLVNSPFWDEAGATEFSSLEFSEFFNDGREFFASRFKLQNIQYSTEAIRMGREEPDQEQLAEEKSDAEKLAYRAGIKRRSRPGDGKWLYGQGDNPED